jgi:hypothetical protein
VTLCEAFAGYGGRWGDDDTIVVALNRAGQEHDVFSVGSPHGERIRTREGSQARRWFRRAEDIFLYGPGNGRELLFEAPDQRIMAVAYTARGDSFAAGQPRQWAATRLRFTSNVPNYDLSPDGKRLATIVADDANGGKPPTHLTFLFNFFDELRRKIPLDK